MNLEKDTYLYDNLPAIGRIESAMIRDHPRKLWDILIVVPWTELVKARHGDEKLRAKPGFVAAHPVKNQMLVFPAPDKDYEARIRYYPPLQEM